MRTWWADAAGVGDAIDEVAELVDGFGVWTLHVRNAFAPIPKPMEAEQLPDLLATADAAVQAYNRGRGDGQRALALPRRLPRW
ncbi:hypothetical protein ACI79G_15190 [Geodermatophilus sp. SYSU D00779]